MATHVVLVHAIIFLLHNVGLSTILSQACTWCLPHGVKRVGWRVVMHLMHCIIRMLYAACSAGFVLAVAVPSFVSVEERGMKGDYGMESCCRCRK